MIDDYNVENVDCVSFIVYIHPDTGQKHAAFWEATPQGLTHTEVRNRLTTKRATCLSEGLVLYDPEHSKWVPITLFDRQIDKDYQSWCENIQIACDTIQACYAPQTDRNKELKNHLGNFFNKLPEVDKDIIRNWNCPPARLVTKFNQTQMQQGEQNAREIS